MLLAPKKLPDITNEVCLLTKDCEQLRGNVAPLLGILTGIDDSIFLV